VHYCSIIVGLYRCVHTECVYVCVYTYRLLDSAKQSAAVTALRCRRRRRTTRGRAWRHRNRGHCRCDHDGQVNNDWIRQQKKAAFVLVCMGHAQQHNASLTTSRPVARRSGSQGARSGSHVPVPARTRRRSRMLSNCLRRVSCYVRSATHARNTNRFHRAL